MLKMILDREFPYIKRLLGNVWERPIHHAFPHICSLNISIHFLSPFPPLAPLPPPVILPSFSSLSLYPSLPSSLPQALYPMSPLLRQKDPPPPFLPRPVWDSTNYSFYRRYLPVLAALSFTLMGINFTLSTALLVFTDHKMIFPSSLDQSPVSQHDSTYRCIYV